MQKKLITISILLLIAIGGLSACGMKDTKGEDHPAVDVPTITEAEKLADDELVVTVNGDDILGITYNLVYAQLKLHAVQTGQELDDDEIKELTIDSLIDRQILLQQAAEDGIKTTEEEAADELERLKLENEDAFETLLEQYQITEESFHQQLIFEMTMNEFMREKIDVTVTDEEVEEAYEEAKEQNPDMPELVEIRDTLKRRIEAFKTNEALQEKIDSIKENAKIEYHI